MQENDPSSSLVCYTHKRRHKNQNRIQNTLKKNQKIIDNYLVRNKKTPSKQGYYIIQKQKMEQLKRRLYQRQKQRPQYILVNPNQNYLKRIRTQNIQNSDNEYAYDDIDYVQKDKGPMIFKNDLGMINNSSFMLPYIPISKQNSQRQLTLSRIISGKGKSSRGSRYLSSTKQYSQEQLETLETKVQKLRRQIRQQKLKNSYNMINNIQKYTPKYLPTINQRELKKSISYGLQPQYQYVVNPEYVSLKQMLKKSNKPRSIVGKFKKVVNAIRFIISLKRFSQKLRIKRQCFFKDSVEQNIYSQITVVKDHFLKSTIQFCSKLPQNQVPSLLIIATDNVKQRQIKINLTRKYINLFLQKIGQMEFKNNIVNIITQTCYYVCKHGGAGATSNYFSAQQLDLMCINKQTLKLRAQKNIQKCQITAFIWIKLILFNIILRSSKINQLKLDAVWHSNFFLFGSLIYQISKVIHIQHMKKVPDIYQIGNWKYINFLNSRDGNQENNIKKQIIPCKSMHITQTIHQKVIKIEQNSTQMIKGTITKAYLSEAYQFQNWETQYKKMLSVTNFIHRRICQYHRQLQKGLI